jgi:hypothetical protein
MGFYYYGLYGFLKKISKVISQYQQTTTFFNMSFDFVLKGFINE